MAIYGLAYVSISEMRDSKIAAILGEEQVFTGEWEFLWTANNKLSKNIDLKCKTFKTLSGASRSQIWQTRRNFLSKEYTTNWNDLPLVF